MSRSLRFASPPDFSRARELLRHIAETRAYGFPRVVDRPLVLYGAGNLGRMAREYFEWLGIPFQYVVDANPRLHRGDTFWEGIDIFGPREVAPEQRASVLLAVCVATVPFSEVRKTLSEEGWLDVVPFYDIAEAYRDQHPLSNGWFTGALDADDVNGIEQTLSRWADDVSRAHHLQFIAWHRLREDWMFSDAPVNIDNRYFIPEVVAALGDQETFVDVGAHQGEISERFRATVCNRYRDVWMIEPDPLNAVKVERAIFELSGDDRGRNHLLKIAVATKSGRTRFFSGLGYASQLSNLGAELADVKTIDQLDLAPSFIKLHLEGRELDALIGAESTLRHSRPIIAATSYHNELGLWRLPLWLMNLFADFNYKHYLRLHSWCGTGTVVYCIPGERSCTLSGAKSMDRGGD